VGVEFITDVRTSLRGNNFIVAFVDYISEQAHWMPGTKSINPVEFDQMFLQAIM